MSLSRQVPLEEGRIVLEEVLEVPGRLPAHPQPIGFDPDVLEHGDAYFENYQESRYMERTLRFRKEMQHLVPGVVHVDGTGRLQTVKREWNPRYHELISAFYELTGVPLLLNTSFNVMGKPIVHAVEDALAVFFTSGLDALVLEDEIFEK